MRRVPGFSVFRMLWSERALWLAILCLACGLAAGSYAGIYTDSSGIAPLAQSVQEQSVMQQAWTTAVPVRLAETLGWLLAALVIGFLPARRLLLMLLIAARGFLLGFTLSVIPAELGLWGVYLSFVTAGLGAVLSVPAFLFSAAAVLLCCQQNGRRQYIRSIGRYGAVLRSSAVLCLISAIYRLTIARLLLNLYP